MIGEELIEGDPKEVMKKKFNLLDLQQQLTKRGELICEGNTETEAELRFGEEAIKRKIKLIPQWKVGSYTFDFKVSKFPILIEIDGRIHDDYQVRQKDCRKDIYALKNGFKVLRFINKDCLNNNVHLILNDVQDVLRFSWNSPREVWLYPLYPHEMIWRTVTKAYWWCYKRYHKYKGTDFRAIRKETKYG